MDRAVFFKSVFLATILVLLLGYSCIPPDDDLWQYSQYEPLLIDRDEANSRIQLTEPQEVVSAGNFYYYNDYIFLVEDELGIHIYDNEDISNPLLVGFIEIANVTDLSINQDYLYAHQSTDLVVLKFISEDSVTFVNRVEDVVDDMPPDLLPLRPEYLENRPNNTIVGKWQLID